MTVSTECRCEFDSDNYRWIENINDYDRTYTGYHWSTTLPYNASHANEKRWYTGGETAWTDRNESRYVSGPSNVTITSSQCWEICEDACRWGDVQYGECNRVYLMYTYSGHVAVTVREHSARAFDPKPIWKTRTTWKL